MDITTVVGLISGISLILMAFLSGGGLVLAVDVPSFFVVVGCSFSGLLLSFPLQEIVRVPEVLVYAFAIPSWKNPSR